ncbi:MAG: hypothetical protein V5A57_03510 [Candidatus Paceibacterota bacterium]
MDSFFYNFIRYLFFPLTLAGSFSFFVIIAQNELSGKDTKNRRSTDEQANLFVLGTLLSILIGLWIAFVLYLSILGVTKVFSYPLPSFSIFLLNTLICTSLSIAVPPFILPARLYNAILLGFFEAIVGAFAHLGFAYIYSLPGEFFRQIPVFPISFFGIFVVIALRTIWFKFKGA